MHGIWLRQAANRLHIDDCKVATGRPASARCCVCVELTPAPVRGPTLMLGAWLSHPCAANTHARSA